MTWPPVVGRGMLLSSRERGEVLTCDVAAGGGQEDVIELQRDRTEVLTCDVAAGGGQGDVIELDWPVLVELLPGVDGAARAGRRRLEVLRARPSHVILRLGLSTDRGHN